MPITLGVCSWSLRPTSPADLARKVEAVGLKTVQLALDPVRTGTWSLDDTNSALTNAGIEAISGMMAMRGEDYSTLESIRRTGGVALDEHWNANLKAASENAAIAAELKIPLVSFHAGFIPEHGEARMNMLQRVGLLAAQFARRGVRVALETGQETAATLLDALDELDRPDVAVNFDPANMILYGMGDPIEALRLLAPRIAQIHIKDARRSPTPGEWGEEVPVGEGDVDWAAFFEVLRSARLSCDLMIEREAGDQRLDDIIAARQLVERHLEIADGG